MSRRNRHARQVRTVPAPITAEHLEVRQLLSTTVPSEVLGSSATWTTSGSPYVLSGDLDIRGGVTLTVNAGVTVTGGRIFVSDDGSGGTLVATGATFGEAVYVRQQGMVTLKSNTFNQGVEIDFYGGSTTSTVTGNAFKGGLNVAPQFISGVAGATGNTFPAETVGVLSTTLNTGQTFAFADTSDITTYSLDGDVDVDSGSTLSVGSGTTVTGGRIFVSDAGTGGTLSASGAKFGEVIYVRQQGVATITNDTFAAGVELDYYAGANGATVTGDAFNGGLTVAPQYVSAVTASSTNTFGGKTLYLLSSTLGTGQTFTWPVTSNVTEYDLDGDVDVDSGSTLSIANGATVTGGRIFVSDAGTGGTLRAASVAFGEVIYIRQQGVATITNDTFAAGVELDYFAGLNTATVTGDAFNGGLTVAPQYVSAVLASTTNTFGGKTLYVLSSTLGTGQTITWPVTSNVSTYDLDGDVDIDSGTTLSIATGATVTGGRIFASDAGTGGTLAASGVKFGEVIYVRQQGVATITNDTFAAGVELDYYAGANTATVTGNTFAGGLTVAPQYAAFVTNNTFPAADIALLSTTINSGTTVTLPAIANVPGYSLDGDVDVTANSTLVIANGNTVTGGRIFISSDSTSGKITALAVKFTEPVYLYAGSSGTLGYDTFTDGLYINVASKVSVANDDLSATVVTAQGSGGTINLAGNYFGTTNTATIEADNIVDKNDNASLPTIAIATPLNYDPTVPDLVVSSLTVSSSTPVAGQAITATVVVHNDNPTIVSQATGLTITLSGATGTRTLAVVDVPALAGGGSSPSLSVTVQLPAATDSFYGTSLPGTYTLIAKADAFNDVVEEFENNNTRAVNITVVKDTTKPTVIFAGFTATPAQALSILFSENVAPSLSIADLALRNTTTNVTVAASNLVLAYNATTNVATVTFKTALAKGTYVLTIAAAGVTDVAGNPLAAAFTFTFAV